MPSKTSNAGKCPNPLKLNVSLIHSVDTLTCLAVPEINSIAAQQMPIWYAPTKKSTMYLKYNNPLYFNPTIYDPV